MDQATVSYPSESEADDQLLVAYRNGDETAAEALFERYYVRLVGLARKEMGPLLRDVEESSDVAQSVFKSVFIQGRERRIEIGPNDSLWPLLATITVNKIRNRVKFWTRKRRDRRCQCSLQEGDLLEAGPAPEDVMKLHDVIQQLLDQFDRPRQGTIQYLLQGLPVAEIAQKTGSSKRTVYRIRQTAMHILEQLLEAS